MNVELSAAKVWIDVCGLDILLKSTKIPERDAKLMAPARKSPKTCLEN